MERMSDGVSVIIACYNGAKRLPESLAHLARQKVSPSIPWEVIVAQDQATSDDTPGVAASFADRFAPGRLHVIKAARPGVACARMTGMEAAKYEFLSYIDDDNWVNPDWVELVHRYLSARPEVGAVGAQGVAVFEDGEMPAWFPRFAATYAAAPQYPEGGDITDRPSHLLWTAGMSLRKSVYQQLLAAGFEFTCTDKLGPRLFQLVRMRAGEDTDLCYAIRALGWRLHYTPELSYHHFMTRNRLNWAYLRRMSREYGQCAVFLAMLRDSTNRTWSPQRRRLESSWMFQVVRAVRQLVRIALHDPRDLLTSAEGSEGRVRADHWLGYLRVLFVLRGGYRKLFDKNRDRYVR